MTVTLPGQVVAITGGARGIGFAAAGRVNELGVKVAIGDVDDVTLKQAAATLGLQCAPTLDVTERDSFAAFLDEVESTLGLTGRRARESTWFLIDQFLARTTEASQKAEGTP